MSCRPARVICEAGFSTTLYNIVTDKIYQIAAIAGEVMVIAGAMIWVTGWIGANYIYAAGATIFAVGRLGEKHDVKDAVVKRLYRQRTFGVVVALFSALVMNLEPGFYLGYYFPRTTWLVLFLVFAVFEVYTAFRIPVAEEKSRRKD